MQRREYRGHKGVTLVADVGGHPRHRPVILLHGGGQTRHSWGTAALDLVRAGFHVIALDLRGHGDSAWAPDGDYSIDAFSGDLRQILATLSMPVALVGASLGGVISLITAGENPGVDIGSIVLVDVVPDTEPEGVKRIQDFMAANPHGFATVDEAAAAVASYLPNRARRADSVGLMKNLRAKEDGRFYWHWDPQWLAHVCSASHQEEARLRMHAAAPNIAVPALVVRGRLSDVVSEAGIQSLRDSIPHLQYVEVTDAAHMVAGDNNDRFNTAVERFLAAVSDRSSRRDN